MVTTTFPSLLIALVAFTVLSVGGEGEYDPTIAEELCDAIEATYPHMSPLLLLPILMIIVFAAIQMSPIPAVLLLSAIGCLFAWYFRVQAQRLHHNWFTTDSLRKPETNFAIHS